MTNLFMIYASAIVLGALHAFEPGHGKTLIAAYMVGTKGRARDGILLGAIVTATHTFSVILLGVVAYMLSTKYSEAVLHNWLGLVSAGLVTLVGAWMLWQRLAGNGHGHVHLFGSEHHHHEQEAEQSHEHLHPHVHPHVHEHGEGHDHHPHVHPQPTQPPARKGLLELLLLGISGGIIPCPAAIAILLAGVASGKLAEGLTMTLLFSLGLGGVMMGIGLLLSQSTHLTNRISQNLDIARKMGIASAALILVIGCYTMFHSIRGILS